MNALCPARDNNSQLYGTSIKSMSFEFNYSALFCQCDTPNIMIMSKQTDCTG